MHSLASNQLVALCLTDAFKNKDWLIAKSIAFGSSYYPAKLSLTAFVKHVSAGKAWTSGCFSNYSRDRADFVSSEILALDCDDHVSVEKALKHPFIKRYAFFVYPTPTSTAEWPRTRIVFLLSEPVMQWRFWEAMQRGLIAYFSDLKPDPACKDVTRMFYGSTILGAYVNYEAILPIEVAGSLTKPEAEHEMKRLQATLYIPASSQQIMTNGSELSQKLVEDVERGLSVNSAAYNDSGFTVDPIPCPMKSHEHDSENPATYWHRDKKILYCHKCGKIYLTHDVAAALRLDIPTYYRHDQLPDDPSIILVSHRYITDYDTKTLIGQCITTLLIKSPTGSGKTELIKQLLLSPHSRILVIAHRRSLVAALVKRLNTNLGNQSPFTSYDKLSSFALRTATRLCICTNSLPKLIELGQPIPTYDLIIFDEIEQQLKHLTGGTFEGSEAVETLHSMNALVEQAKLVLALDAYASPLSLKWLKSVRSADTFRMIINDYPTSKGSMHMMKDLASLMLCADEVLTKDETEGAIVFAVASKAVAKWLYSYFTGKPMLTQEEQNELLTDIDPEIIASLARSPHTIQQNQVVMISGDNTDSAGTRAFLNNIDKRLSGLKVLIHTSAIGTGIDIQAWVKAVFGIFRSGILPADEALQMLARCRKASEYFVLIEGKAHNRETNPKKLYQTQMDKIQLTGSLLGGNIRGQWYIDAAGVVQLGNQQQNYLRFWSQVTGSLHQAHNTFRKQFTAMAQREFVMDKQNQSQLVEEEMDEEQVEMVKTLAQIKAGVQGIDQHLILTCVPITRGNFQHFQSEYQVTPTIHAGYIRWTIERGYRQTITPAIYRHWLGGGLGHLYQFIRLYDPLSELQDYDLNQAVRGYAIPARSHATARTRLIQSALTQVFGTYTHLEQTDYISKQVIIERLTGYIAKYDKQLRILFGWRSSQDMNPMNVIRRLVSELGLKMPISRSGDSKGKYGICQKHLAEMQSYYTAYQTPLVAEEDIARSA